MRLVGRADPAREVEQHLGGGAGHVAQRLIDRGQRGADPGRDRQVVVPDHGQVGRDVEAELPGRPQHPHRLQVRAGEDRRRSVGPTEQLHALPVAGVEVEGPGADQAGIDGYAELLVGAAEARRARPGAEHALRTGDDRDPTVPELQQVAGGEQAAVPVVRAHGGHRGRAGAVGVDHDDRDRLTPQPLPLLAGQVAHHQQNAERASGDHRVEPRRRRSVRAAQLRQHHGEPLRGGHGLDPPDDLQRPVGAELVEHQVDLPLTGGPAAAAAVVVPLQAGLDAGPGARRDVRSSVEDLGDRSRRDTDLPRDGRDGRDRRGAERRRWTVYGHRNPCNRSAKISGNCST